MTARLARGGLFIDRSAPLEFTFDGRRLTGCRGDTLASALLANGCLLQGRSFKYHRPRGPMASGVEEPNALVTLGTGARAEPNTRATDLPLAEGMVAASQNHWPSLARDLGAVSGALGRFLPAGFYYKTFMAPRPAWRHLFEPLIRRAAGLGRAPDQPDADRYEHIHVHCDILVAGGGTAGLQAAVTAASAGQRVLLLEQSAQWMARGRVDGDAIGGLAPGDWLAGRLDALAAHGAQARLNTRVLGVYDHGLVLAEETLDVTPGDGRPRKRLWRIRAGRVIAATGALERPLAFAGNDVPGVMLASAMRDYLVGYGVSPGDRTVLVTCCDDAYRTAIALRQAGLSVPAILDTRAEATGDLPARARALGIRVQTGHAIARVLGRSRVTGVQTCLQAGEGAVVEEIPCDAVAMSGGWSPVVHLWSHCGGRLLWDEDMGLFRPDPSRPPTGADGAAMVATAGAASGALVLAETLRDATEAAGGDQVPEAEPLAETPAEPVWLMPQGAGPELRRKSFLDFQNDVTVADVQLAAREGYVSVEHAKRYTTLGMATDQGKLGNVAGIGVLAGAIGAPVAAVGTTTFRPPYAPATIGTLVGAARGPLFQPLRRTPLHDRHEALGARWEPVGLWRRPLAYPQGGETLQQAIDREVLAVRGRVGMLDASTLGKILVKGPDAGRFLDMIYTGVMSSLPVGRCRYGLICNEQGFLIDDGVVVRLADDAWLCHTTSGGAARIHGWMEEWLQTEWWDWQVFTADLTEVRGQIVLAGPRAREVLERLGGMDVSARALPFMGWAEGVLAGIPCRVYRISFSGELSFEIAVPAGQTGAFWDRLRAEGAVPYGTGALHVLRAEKGFIIVGDESDGTVTPHDLGLGWAVSKTKADFLGKRGMERAALRDPARWVLVGLETLDGAVIPEGAHVVDEGVNANGQRNVQGRVTSSLWSPVLRRGIALALLRGGRDREGEEVRLAVRGGEIAARVVAPVWYDRDGVRQHV